METTMPTPRRDTIDVLLTVCGFFALAALIVIALGKFHFGMTGVGGPLSVDGPLHVQGNLYVGGPVTVHGRIQARSVTVGGPVQTPFPMGERPGPAPQVYKTSLAVGGPLTVRGPLIVDGSLVVGGPLTSEPTK
jgi:hypothetical protein